MASSDTNSAEAKNQGSGAQRFSVEPWNKQDNKGWWADVVTRELFEQG